MAEKQFDKFIVFKRNDIEKLCEEYQGFAAVLEHVCNQVFTLRKAEGRDVAPKYIVCNQDEPYAEKVWQVILEGEDAKCGGGEG